MTYPPSSATSPFAAFLAPWGAGEEIDFEAFLAPHTECETKLREFEARNALIEAELERAVPGPPGVKVVAA